MYVDYPPYDEPFVDPFDDEFFDSLACPECEASVDDEFDALEQDVISDLLDDLGRLGFTVRRTRYVALDDVATLATMISTDLILQSPYEGREGATFVAGVTSVRNRILAAIDSLR